MKTKWLVVIVWLLMWASNFYLPRWYEDTFQPGRDQRRRLDVLLDVLGESRTLLARFLWFTAENYHEILEQQGAVTFQERDLIPLYRMMTYLDPRMDEPFDILGWDMLKGYNDVPRCLEILDEGLVYNPTSFLLQFRKAFCLHALKRYAEAIPPGEGALKAARDDVDSLNSCRILYRCYEEQQRWDDALRVLDIWLSWRPGDPVGTMEKAKTLERAGKSR